MYKLYEIYIANYCEEVNQHRCSEESAQWLESVDNIQPVLAITTKNYCEEFSLKDHYGALYNRQQVEARTNRNAVKGFF